MTHITVMWENAQKSNYVSHSRTGAHLPPPPPARARSHPTSTPACRHPHGGGAWSLKSRVAGLTNTQLITRSSFFTKNKRTKLQLHEQIHGAPGSSGWFNDNGNIA
jgi:hypothetical protein